jgi:uncharacterized membrane protein
MTDKDKKKKRSIFGFFGKKLRQSFITGLLVITPLVISLWILYNIFEKADGLLGAIITRVIGRNVPGLGVILLVILIIAAGIFARNYVGRILINWGNLVLFRIPLFNKIYIALKQIFEVFLGERKTIFQRVVLFQYPRKGIYSVGFVTSESRGEIQTRTEQDLVNVFLPTTPNPTSGFLLFIPEEDLIELDMSVEEGIKLVISGGAVTPYYVSDAGFSVGAENLVSDGKKSSEGIIGSSDEHGQG